MQSGLQCTLASSVASWNHMGVFNHISGWRYLTKTHIPTHACADTHRRMRVHTHRRTHTHTYACACINRTSEWLFLKNAGGRVHTPAWFIVPWRCFTCSREGENSPHLLFQVHMIFHWFYPNRCRTLTRRVCASLKSVACGVMRPRNHFDATFLNES